MSAITAPAQAQAQARESNRSTREARWFYFFISPWLLGFIFLTVIPLAFGFYISMTNYNGINLNNLKFIGFDNYARAFRDANVIASLERTIIFTGSKVPLQVGISLAIAYMLTLNIRFTGIFRTLFYIPHIIPVVAAIWMWQLMFEKNFGLVNASISLFSPDTAIGWLVDHPTGVLVLLSTWLGTGGGMVIFIAGLQGVPRELQEAAKVDGANQMRVFYHVTLPLLTPVLFFQVVMSLIGSLQVMVEPILLSPGANGALSINVPLANRFFLVNAYREIFIAGRFGYGSALVWLLFAFILILTMLLIFSTRYWVYSEDTPANQS